MLSADAICARLYADVPDDARLIVVPSPDEVNLRKHGGASLDLRLGRWFRSFKQTQVPTVTLTDHSSDPERRIQSERAKEHFVPFGAPFVLHPGRFVLGVTLEWLRLPAGLSGYVTGKSSLGRHGLVIETAAGLHPRFTGCLTLELANVGEVPLEISPGMEICQVFLHETTAAESSDAASGGTRFSGQRKPLLSRPKADELFHKIRDWKP